MLGPMQRTWKLDRRIGQESTHACATCEQIAMHLHISGCDRDALAYLGAREGRGKRDERREKGEEREREREGNGSREREVVLKSDQKISTKKMRTSKPCSI